MAFYTQVMPKDVIELEEIIAQELKDELCTPSYDEFTYESTKSC